jgi:hypothetical protein
MLNFAVKYYIVNLINEFYKGYIENFLIDSLKNYKQIIN